MGYLTSFIFCPAGARFQQRLDFGEFAFIEVFAFQKALYHGGERTVESGA